MTRYVHYEEPLSIPMEFIDDVLELSKFLMAKLNIYIPTVDLYRMWRHISYMSDLKWLEIDFAPRGETREEFLLECINTYCRDMF